MPKDWDGKLTVCVDFDGVVHLYESGWKGIDIIEDAPHPHAWDALSEYVKHFHVHIYSARSEEQRGIDAMKKWFELHSCPKEVFEKLIFSVKKPTAAVYLDDRAWRFDGVFPTAEEIKAFRPWNKRR